MSDIKPLPFTPPITGLSEKALAIHHDKLYAGYVAKKDEVQSTLSSLVAAGDFASANPSYSTLRSLKDGETFAVNGVYLHEWYFDVLGGNGAASGPLVDAIAHAFGSFEAFQAYFSGCGMAARGWVVLAWDMHDKALRVYTGDTHNQGGVWGCMPILVLDVYEHAYFMDYGADRKAYIADYWKNLNWDKANELYQNATHI